MPHAPLWNYAQEPVAYPQAVAAMEGHVQAMIEGKAGEKIWSLEHPPLYTAGVRAQESDILEETPFPIYTEARGEGLRPITDRGSGSSIRCSI